MSASSRRAAGLRPQRSLAPDFFGRGSVRAGSTDFSASWRADINRGRNELTLGHIAEAEEILNKVMAAVEPLLTGTDERTARQAAEIVAVTNVLLGRVAEALGQPEQAQSSFSKASLLFERVSPVSNLPVQDCTEFGLALVKTGREVDAISVLEQAVRGADPPVEAYRLLGHCYRIVGRLEDAEQQLSKAIQLAPYDAETAIELAQVFAVSSKPAEASQLYQQAATVVAEDGNIDAAIKLVEQSIGLHADADALALQGDLLRTQGQYRRALGSLDQALRLDPDNRYALTTKGATLNALGRNRQAITILNQILVLEPTNVWAMQNLADSLWAVGDSSGALVVLNKAEALSPDDALTLVLKGGICSALGRHSDALEALEKARMLDPEDTSILLSLSAAQREAGELHTALGTLDGFLVLYPDDAVALRAKLEILEDEGRNEDAVALLQRIVQRGSHRRWAEPDLGVLLHNMARYEEAVPVLKRALAQKRRSKSERASLLATLASALDNLDRQSEALTALDQAVALSPRDPWMLTTLAQVLCNTGEYLLATDVIEHALSQDAGNAGCYVLKGWALKNAGMEYADGTHAAYAKAVELEPENLWAVQGLADALALLGRTAEGEERHRWVIEHATSPDRPADADTLALQGWSTYKLGQFEEALSLLRKVLILRPDLLYPQFDTALVTLCSGRRSLALEKYSAALGATEAKDVLRQRGLVAVARRGLRDAARDHPNLFRTSDIRRVDGRLTSAFQTADRQSRELLAGYAFPAVFKAQNQ